MFENEPKRTQFLLWNTSSKQLEAQFNGRFVYFAPGEKKSFGDRDDVLNHIHMKLDRYGVVKIKAESSEEENKQALIDGLRARHKTLRFVIEQFQTMNKAREAMKQAQEVPSDFVSECVIEDEMIQQKIKDLGDEKTKLVEQYFQRLEAKEKEVIENISNQEKLVVTASGVKIEKRRGRPPKEKVQENVSTPAEIEG